MDEPSENPANRPDEPPHEAADPPLSLQARTPGPRGLAPKLAFAALAVVLLVALIVAALAFTRHSRQSDAARPAAGFLPRPAT
jgi:hypothetical protein